MKKQSVICVLIISLLLLCSCGREIVKVVGTDGTDGTKENRQYTAAVDTSNHTITVDGDIYSYEQTNNSLKVIWPDGSFYIETYQPAGANTTVGTGGTHGTIDSSRYLPPDVIFDILKPVLNQPQMALSVLQAVIILLGAVTVVFPRIFWFICYGWRFRDAEPGPLALPVFRCIGVLMIAAAVGKFFL